jgi:cysteinyl-tRNA synthetase
MRVIGFVLVSVSILLLTTGCISSPEERDYRQDMRNFVQNISKYAKEKQPGFLISPQNGHELTTLDGDPSGEIAGEYLDSIDGIGREDLFYGYTGDDEPTPAGEGESIVAFLEIARENGASVLVTDYCSTWSHIDRSYSESEKLGFVSFAADSRELNTIPSYPSQPHNLNADDISSLADVRNFLYLINPSSFGDVEAFLESVRKTCYDLLIIDPYFDDRALTPGEIESLGTKANGGGRLVMAYMSIGEAEDYRYYWDDKWESDPPAWLGRENPEWEGNFKIEYWNEGWQVLIFGSNDSYLDKIIGAGFDGVYLDLIDAYEYFE